MGVVGTATVAIVSYRISRKTNQATIEAAKDNTDKTIAGAHADIRSTLDATREGQLADQYSRAIEQLGSENLDIRSGGDPRQCSANALESRPETLPPVRRDQKHFPVRRPARQLRGSDPAPIQCILNIEDGIDA